MVMRRVKPGQEYRAAGVDYRLLQGWKDMVVAGMQATNTFPNKYGVRVIKTRHSHGGVWEYEGKGPHCFVQTTEGLGGKDWLAAWMKKFGGDKEGKGFFNCGICNVKMAGNDNAAMGAQPVTYTDEVVAGSGDFFKDLSVCANLVGGLVEGCRQSGMAMIAGETPAIPFLVQARPPIDPAGAPILSGCAVGLVAPTRRLITGDKLRAGDSIVGVRSAGLHANGFSLFFKEGLLLPDQFCTRLESGVTIGEEALTPTMCYVRLVQALLDNEVDIHVALPGTGDGVAKLAFDKRSFTYRIHTWPEVSPIFRFILERMGVSIEGCLKTFNWGIGYYFFVPKRMVNRTLDIARKTGYEAWEVGVVKEGMRRTIFHPAGHKRIILPPPGKE
ncbi:MAG: AIR synthase-related protein [Candidatus Pacebacteria bacterium]|nr:AIR synthase-related protein [Candidatus Paceibacterota bacterium]